MARVSRFWRFGSGDGKFSGEEEEEKRRTPACEYSAARFCAPEDVGGFHGQQVPGSSGSDAVGCALIVGYRL